MLVVLFVDKGVCTFSKGISPKVTEVWTYYNVAIKHISYNTLETPLKWDAGSQR